MTDEEDARLVDLLKKKQIEWCRKNGAVITIKTAWEINAMQKEYMAMCIVRLVTP